MNEEVHIPSYAFEGEIKKSQYFCEKEIITGNRIDYCYHRKGHRGQCRLQSRFDPFARNTDGQLVGIALNEGSCLSRFLPVLVVKRHLFYFALPILGNWLHIIGGKDAVAPGCKGILWNHRNIVTGVEW